jgi:hypothetical protein
MRAVMRDDGERELIDDSLERTRLYDGAFHALAGTWHRADGDDGIVAYPVEGLCHAIAAGHDLHEVHVQWRDQHGHAQIAAADADERAGDLPGSCTRLVWAERGLDALTAFAVHLHGEQRRVDGDARDTELHRILREAIDPGITPRRIQLLVGESCRLGRLCIVAEGSEPGAPRAHATRAGLLGRGLQRRRRYTRRWQRIRC